MEHKAGFIGIVGKPNVGKSTFSNAFVGERLSIITAKAQTTRHRILGFMNDENYQLIISDTPGVIKPSYKLQEKMMDFVGEIFTDSDLILAMVSMDDPDLPDDIIEQLRKSEIPAYLLINKCDLSDQEKIIPIIAKYQALDIFENVFAISALNGLDREKLIEEILVHIPDHPPFYPKDQLTDKPERFFRGRNDP